MEWHSWHMTELESCNFLHLCGMSMAALVVCAIVLLAIL